MESLPLRSGHGPLAGVTGSGVTIASMLVTSTALFKTCPPGIGRLFYTEDDV